MLIKKGTALLTGALFILNQVMLPGQGLAVDVAVKGNSAIKEGALSSRQMSIPDKLGTIEEFHQGTNGKTIIYIQDAHDSLEAQENIAKIINHLVEHNGVRTVFEEGYEGPVPTDEFFSIFKDPRAKEKVSYFLMDKLRLGGAEYAHVNRKGDFELIGADSIEFHKKNIEWYKKSAETREAVAKDLNDIRKEIEVLVDRHFPREIKSWIKLKERLDHNQINLLDYLKRITKISNLRTYPQMAILLKSESSKDEEMIKAAQSIDGRTLFQEIGRFETDYAKKMLGTGPQKDLSLKIYRILKSINLLDRLSRIEVISEEFELAKRALRELNTEEIAIFLFRVTGKPVILSNLWEQRIQNAVRFYETAEARDGFFENALARYGKAEGNVTAALVFGGFHKNRVKNILKKKNFSYLIVAPKMTGISQKHQDYYKSLMSVGHYSFEVPVVPLARAARVLSAIERQDGLLARIHDVWNPAWLTLNLEDLDLRLLPALEAARSEARAENMRDSVLTLYELKGARFDPNLMGHYVRFKLGEVSSRIGFLDELAGLVATNLGEDIKREPDQWAIASAATHGLGLEFSKILKSRLDLSVPLPVLPIEKTKVPGNYTAEKKAKRTEIAKAVMHLRENPRYPHILVIDDMVVTGALMSVISELLEEKGIDRRHIHPFAFVRARFRSPSREFQMLRETAKDMTADELARIINHPGYYLTSGMIKVIAQLGEAKVNRLAGLIQPRRWAKLKSEIMAYYQNDDLPEKFEGLFNSWSSYNGTEQVVRALLNKYPVIDGEFHDLLDTAVRLIPVEPLLHSLEFHQVQRMIPYQAKEQPSLNYEDAGRENWEPADLDGFKTRMPSPKLYREPWFQERLKYLKEHGNELRDLLHERIVEKVGTARYSLAVGGSFLYIEKPRARDLDLIIVTDDPHTHLQIFGSQEMEVPGISRLFPWLSGDYVDMNVTPRVALSHSDSETSMAMLEDLSGYLFLVGNPVPSQPVYLRLFAIMWRWGRQSWVLQREPKAFVFKKMKLRAQIARVKFLEILAEMNVNLNPVDQTVLENGKIFEPGEFETVEDYYSRISQMIGNYIDLIEGVMKRDIRSRILDKLRSEPPAQSQTDEIKVSEIAPAFCQTCGISKYSDALHQALASTPNVRAAKFEVSEAESTRKDAVHLTEVLRDALRASPDVVHIHFADGLLRRDKSENFVAFTEKHAELLRSAPASVATIYELGPRMLSANRLPQNILADTTSLERAQMWDRLRTEMKRLLNSVDGILVHSTDQLRYLKEDPEYDEIVKRRRILIQSMRHGIPTASEDYADSQKREKIRRSMRQKYGISDDQVVMIQFGFIRSNKYGFDILALLQRNPRLVWFLAGGPRQPSHRAYQDQLIQRAQDLGVRDRVIVTGPVPDEQISDMYAAADMAIVPYETGSESYVLATGLAHQLPIAASALPFVYELRRRYGDAVYRASTDEEFERQVRYLSDHPDYRKQLGERAVIAHELDSWARIAERTSQFFRRVVAHKRQNLSRSEARQAVAVEE
ncbi:MAG: glycosyltransferase family 4 protein, partial [Candidatus Omnitrophica bacterium]|nr:glycosyltransferase family 4 protein [Candidatus Omnitrophota bacterium]